MALAPSECETAPEVGRKCHDTGAGKLIDRRRKSRIESQPMKPRHAAALALVGWYLMLPPPDLAAVHRTDAPLSRWLQIGTYNSVKECNENRAALKPQTEDVRWAVTQAVCIAADDLRLKKPK
jgi:hypothetical protein